MVSPSFQAYDLCLFCPQTYQTLIFQAYCHTLPELFRPKLVFRKASLLLPQSTGGRFYCVTPCVFGTVVLISGLFFFTVFPSFVTPFCNFIVSLFWGNVKFFRFLHLNACPFVSFPFFVILILCFIS